MAADAAETAPAATAATAAIPNKQHILGKGTGKGKLSVPSSRSAAVMLLALHPEEYDIRQGSVWRDRPGAGALCSACLLLFAWRDGSHGRTPVV